MRAHDAYEARTGPTGRRKQPMQAAKHSSPDPESQSFRHSDAVARQSSSATAALARIPVTLNIRSRRIRSCREGAMGPRIAKRMVPDRLGSVPRGSVDVVTLRRRRPVCWCVAAMAQNLCSTNWIRSRVSSIRRLFWSHSGPMAGLRFQRGAGWCCSCSRGARRPGVVGVRRRGFAARCCVLRVG